MNRLLLSAILLAVLSLVPTMASAQTAGGAEIFDEFRLGIVAANPEFIDADHPESDQIGINAELLFTAFDFDTRANPQEGFIRSMLTPRLHLGSTINLDEDGTSTFYGGLTWQYALTERFFVEASFGLSANNGEPDGAYEGTETFTDSTGNTYERAKLSRARLGSNVTFRESIALGYSITERMNIILSLAHNSHASLFDDKNRGLTNISIKTGFKF